MANASWAAARTFPWVFQMQFLTPELYRLVYNYIIHLGGAESEQVTMIQNSEPEEKPDLGAMSRAGKGRRTVIVVGFVIAIALTIPAFFRWVAAPDISDPYFSYGTGGSRYRVVDVIDNYRVEVPFTFDIDPGVQEVVLEFSGEHARLPGISLHDNTVRVINGKASSRVIILLNEKSPLRAGTHRLIVVARDPATDTIIRKGRIQFNYNMDELFGKCSC